MISIVAAIGNNRVLGKNNQLLWHIPDDLKRFKQLTLGHPVIMGRKTFESILSVLGKPLPGRTNIVVTRQEYRGRFSVEEGVVRVDSIPDAIEKAKQAPGGEEIIIGGGGEIYRQALPFVDKLYLTLIEDEKEGDSFFPEYESEFTKVTFEELREYEGLKYRWIDLER
jgi:dihydrofolate reductase